MMYICWKEDDPYTVLQAKYAVSTRLEVWEETNDLISMVWILW